MSRLSYSTWGIVALVTFACGGKTSESDPSGVGAGGSAQGGSNGVSGAAGRGGTAGGLAGTMGSTGRGGSLGGSGAAGTPGAGGSAGTTIGSGGAVTGGAGGVGGSAEQLLEAICRHYEMHGCGNAGCQMDLKGRFDINERWGCGDEWLGTESCALGDPTPCGGREPCADALAVLQRCIDEADICIRGNHPSGGCEIGCEDWGTDCIPSSAGLLCTCTAGSGSGIRFETSDACQSEEWLKTIRSACQ